MDRLPDELVFLILRYLDALDLVRLQGVSHRMLHLTRDTTIWKSICYDDSRAEIARRKRLLEGELEQKFLDLRDAVRLSSGPPHGDVARQQASESIKTPPDDRQRALANWEPGYPGESIDYYQEYIQRHAKITIDWKDLPSGDTADQEEVREATGLALLETPLGAAFAVSPVDDGSIVVRDLLSSNEVVSQSKTGLLTPGVSGTSTRQAIMTDQSCVEGVSINEHNRAFFAVGSLLHEVDLNTLALVSSQQYPFALTALSKCSSHQPLVVGTNQTIHLYDAREPTKSSHNNQHTRLELIAGPDRAAGHITLTQPGPLTIMHAPTTTESIWVAGRFTSMLQYSLRMFPRLESTVHSGARGISSLTFLPYPFVPRSMSLVDNRGLTISEYTARRSQSSWTMICAGAYKGKGSLELYPMSSATSSCIGEKYLNRQTASSSKLLSVANHGGRIVYGDGDGKLWWKERDGYEPVRSFNINEADEGSNDTHAPGLWNSSTESHSDNDIVQKILPFKDHTSAVGHTPEKLLLWTGAGRVGVLGFGPNSGSSLDEFHDAVEIQAETASERARYDAERQYAMAMRRALERNADEVRFVRGLGMGDLRP